MTAPDTTADRPVARSSRWLRRFRVDLLLVLLALVAVGPWVQKYTAQPASRYVLSAALWDDHTVDLTDYSHAMWVDLVYSDGELRSDKAPLQPLLAAPVYGIARAVGAEPASDLRRDGNLGLWWVAVWSSVLPFAAVLVMMRRIASRAVGRAALPATIALGFATVMLPYASELYGHLLAAALIFGAWLVVREHDLTRGRLVVSGLLAGAAVATEYQTMVIAVVVVAALVPIARIRLGWFALGALPPALVTAGYQWVAFGDPSTVPYSLKEHHQSGLVGISIPSPGHVVEVFVGNRGLVISGPIVIVALGGAVWLLREATSAALRRDAVVAIAAFAAMLFVQAGGSQPPYGGASVGPRYLIPTFAFLVIPLAAVWYRVHVLCWAATAVGMFTMGAALVTRHLVGEGGLAVRVHLDRILDGDLTPTVLSGLMGDVGIVVVVAAVLAVALVLAKVHSHDGPGQHDPVVTAHHDVH